MRMCNPVSHKRSTQYTWLTLKEDESALLVYLTISLWYGALDNILSKPFFRGFELASPGYLIFFSVIKQAGFFKDSKF